MKRAGLPRSFFLFKIVSWCNTVVFFEGFIEIAVVAIAEHGRYFFNGVNGEYDQIPS
jgi:hypothetical protein